MTSLLSEQPGMINAYLPRIIFIALFFIGTVVQVSAQDSQSEVDLINLSLEELADIQFMSVSRHIHKNELITLLLDWVTRRTDLEYNRDQIPEIKRASNQDLVEIAFSRPVPLSSDSSKTNISGLYNFKSNTIFLRDDVDLKTQAGKAIFLHELVHYLQYQNKINLDVKYLNELESQAYMLESRYLSESYIFH